MTKIEEIKVQAICLMAEKSFDAMSLRQLAKAVGLQPGSIYVHYQSKVQLLLELCCDYMEDLLSVWKELRKRRAQGDEQLLSFVAIYVGFYYAREMESRIFHLDARCLPPRERAAVDELKGCYESELEAILRQGVESDVFQLTDLRVARLGILSLLQGICAAGCGASALSELQAFDVCAAAILRLVGSRCSSSWGVGASRYHAELLSAGAGARDSAVCADGPGS